MIWACDCCVSHYVCQLLFFHYKSFVIKFFITVVLFRCVVYNLHLPWLPQNILGHQKKGVQCLRNKTTISLQLAVVGLILLGFIQQWPSAEATLCHSMVLELLHASCCVVLPLETAAVTISASDSSPYISPPRFGPIGKHISRHLIRITRLVMIIK